MRRQEGQRRHCQWSEVHYEEAEGSEQGLPLGEVYYEKVVRVRAGIASGVRFTTMAERSEQASPMW